MNRVAYIVALLISSLLPARAFATTYTSASCSQTDVQTAINLASNGDTVIISKTGSPCTWASTIVVNGVGIDITGTGTPNTGGGTTGAGSADTTIIDAASAPLIEFTNLSYGQTAKVELLTMSAAGAGTNTILASLGFQGTCTVSGCANIRVDNINYTAMTWGNALTGGFVIISDVFGVLDHNTTIESVTDVAGPTLVQVNYPSWQGVGDWGDNSFFSADTLGTAQAIYIENNSLSGTRGSENDVPFNNNPGGARYVCRFNSFPNMSGVGMCSGHGTAWTGRPRGQRQVEVYYNTANSSASCNALNGLNSGIGYYFSNSFTGIGCNAMVDVDIVRVTDTVGAPWGQCDGTQPWDQSPFTTTSQCIDQPGRGPGLLLQGGSSGSAVGMFLVSNPGTPCNGASVGTCWTNPALDPIYEAGETTPNAATPVNLFPDSTATRLLLNRDAYAEVSQTAQTSATSPFNGTTGTGYGTLANRPTTCTTGVGYWATDQGNWNTYNSLQSGELYICTATNTWSMNYEPYTYPHPLDTGGGGTPTPPAPATQLLAKAN